MIGLAAGAFFAFGALLVLFGANGTEIIETLSIDDERLGLVGSMLSLGLGVGIRAGGPAVDRAPRRPLFLAACGVVILATTTVGPWTSFSALLVHTACIGFGAGFYETLLNASIVERSGEKASRRLLFVHAAATLGAAATPLAIAVLRESVTLPWFESFRLAGLLHVVIALLSFATTMSARGPTAGSDRATAGRTPAVPIPASPRATSATPAMTETRPAERPPGSDPTALAAVCLATFAYVGIESAFTLFVARHSQLSLGLDAVRGDAAISALWIGLLVGRIVAGLSPFAPGAGWVAAWATAGSGLILAFGLGAIAAPELVMAFTGFALGGAFPILIALAGSSLPGRAGTAVGLAAGLGSLGGFVVPWLTGHVAMAADLSTAFAALAGWMWLLAGAAAIVHWRRCRNAIV
jgi:fucose permease